MCLCLASPVVTSYVTTVHHQNQDTDISITSRPSYTCLCVCVYTFFSILSRVDSCNHTTATYRRVLSPQRNSLMGPFLTIPPLPVPNMGGHQSVLYNFCHFKISFFIDSVQLHDKNKNKIISPILLCSIIISCHLQWQSFVQFLFSLESMHFVYIMH